MSPRRLGGWEPREFHEYVYEDERLVGVVVTREAEWTPDGVALMRAHLMNQADRGPHGLPMSEVTDIANQYAYVANEVPRVDYAEKTRLDSQKAYYDRWDSKDNPVNRHGHIWMVERARS